MATKNNATCSICGKSYHMCVSCKDVINAAPWKKHTCTSEHYKVYQVIHGLSTKVYNKDEAKSKLQNIDLSDLENFRDNIKDIIKDIMKSGETEKPRMYRRKRDIETIDVVKSDDVVSEVESEDVSEVVPEDVASE